MKKNLIDIYKADLETMNHDRIAYLKLVAELANRLLQVDDTFRDSDLYKRVRANLRCKEATRDAIG